MINNRSVLTVPNNVGYLPTIGAYVRAVAAKVGFEDQVVSRIRLAVDEACTHVIETSFETGEAATFDVICEESDVGLRVIIADQGMPFNPAAVEDYDPAAGLDRELGGLGFFLMKQLMDEVRFVSKGPEGKALHLVKYLEAGSIASLLSEDDLQPYESYAARVKPARPGSYEFRLMQPAEAVEVAKCVYKTYGYTYPGEHIYYPDRLIAMNRSGEQKSFVAITDRGEVAGHCAIFGGNNETPIRELGQAAVDPAHRSRGLLTRLLQYAIDRSQEQGMAGLFGEPVTNHLHSQRASLKLGFRETALFLGHIPQSVYFKKIAGEELSQRLTLVYSFLPLGNCGRSQIYVPWHHRGILSCIYEGLGLDRELLNVSPGELYGQRPDQSALSTHVMSAIDVARIQIDSYGQYVVSEIEIKLNELCRKGMSCIQLDLPLTNPWTALICAHFEALGFVLAGMLPDAGGQDILRLQYLNVPIDFDRILVASDTAKVLRDYIRKQFDTVPACGSLTV